jgi:hypothetical protein
MPKSAGDISVRVVSVLPLVRFEGEAIRADLDPRYVVALMLDKSKQNHAIQGSDVIFPVHEVAFFAIHSVTQLFMSSEVVGESFRLRIEMDTVAGTRRYRLQLI